MKLSHLRQIVDYMQSYKQITAAYRISDTQIHLIFDRDTIWAFEMKRGESTIFIAGTSERGKVYQAPFDVLLAKRFGRSSIESVTLHNDDKIIRIQVCQSGSYKSSATLLQLEFTGKYTNAIMLDKEEIVLEALRHIDASASSRIVRVGCKLIDPLAPPYQAQDYPIGDVRAFLIAEYERVQREALEKIKKEKIAFLGRRKEKLIRHLENLEDEKAYTNESETLQHYGHLILANLHRIKPYASEVKLDDFEGNPINIPLDRSVSNPSMIAEQFFRRSKKAKQKGLGLHKERQNLEEKIRHTDLFIQNVLEAKTPEGIAILFPSKSSGRKIKSNEGIDEFWIEGVKVSIGKNEKGNIELLQRAKAKDIWMHLKDIPSAHVIISTDKQQLPASLLETAAKLCVDFSVFEKGRYLVDYTPRRDVKVQEGASVLYTKYNTLTVEKG